MLGVEETELLVGKFLLVMRHWEVGQRRHVDKIPLLRVPICNDAQSRYLTMMTRRMADGRYSEELLVITKHQKRRCADYNRSQRSKTTAGIKYKQGDANLWMVVGGEVLAPFLLILLVQGMTSFSVVSATGHHGPRPVRI